MLEFVVGSLLVLALGMAFRETKEHDRPRDRGTHVHGRDVWDGMASSASLLSQMYSGVHQSERLLPEMEEIYADEMDADNTAFLSALSTDELKTA